MKVSLNSIRGLNHWYKTTSDVTAIGVDKLIEKIGAQLGAVEETVDAGIKYEGALIVKVLTCEKHPNANKLSICTIDTGKAKVQLVCGAPNVREGMLAVWLPPGMVVPETAGKDPFVLEAREIRGVVSNGMLASPKELALGDSHFGLLEVDIDVKPGTPFAEAYNLKDDLVLDIENKMFTHRPDCFGYLGVSRELAGIQGMPFKSPDWYKADIDFPKADAGKLPLKFKNELPNLVPRFLLSVISGVTVGPSPVWLQAFLAEIGVKSINNIVDYTNFFMLQTAQPLHAYDYDKVKTLSGGDPTIVVRNAKPGEKVKLLNGKTIEPRAEDIVIATDKQIIGIGGVMGGSETEVDAKTTNIILECGTFDMYTVRRTSMALGLFTDASTRFTKGQSPLQNKAVITKTAIDACEMSGGKIASALIDDNHLSDAVKKRNSLFPPVKVTRDFINARLGLDLSAGDMKKLLENVEFDVDTARDELTVKAPFWRTDIELREDVVEEVGRLYGYDHLPLVLPKRDLTPTKKDHLLEAKAEIRRRLSRAGANEVLTYSFVPGDLLDKAGQDKANAYQVANALSPDLQYYRVSMAPSLLEKVHPNIKAGHDRFALFEIGRVHGVDFVDKEGLPDEHEYTALIITAADKLKPASAAYYQAQKYLTELVKEEVVFKPVGQEMTKFDVVKPYNIERAAMVSLKGGDYLGIIGEYKPAVSRALKLPKYTAGFEIDSKVLQKVVTQGSSYQPLSRYPKVNQDLSLKVAKDLSYAQVYEYVDKQLDANAIDGTRIDLSPVDIYQADDGPKHFTFRFTVTTLNRTLTDKEVAKVLDAVAEDAKKDLKAERL